MAAISIDEFRGYDALTENLRQLVETAPDLLTLTSIGDTPQGRSLWCVTAANERSGPPADRRPALLVTATLHATELAGSRVCLHLLEHLVEHYGEDATVTRRLDEGAFYVVPRIAADGADYVLETRSGGVRSRHVDLDPADVEPDAVLPADVNGDGRILTMRWPDPDGDRQTLPDDDRVLVPRAPGASVGPAEEAGGRRYRTAIEGTVPDYRGGPVSKADGRNDFNRNFPAEAWRPIDWRGHGKYPLSEPETRAVAEFLYDHPNVTGVVDLHTGNPAIFHPSAVLDDRSGRDADLLERIGRRAEELTGFPYLSSYREARTGERITELPGSLKDFAYERTGSLAYVVELGMCYNSLGMETADLAMPTHEHEREWGRRLIAYHDEHPEAGLFHDWEPFEHPQLGPVEIGGWDRVRFANPPLSELESIAERVTDFLLELADRTPAVRIADPRVEPLGAGLAKVTASVVNRGSLPTNLTERGRETVQDDRPLVRIRTDGEVVSGERTRRLDHLAALTGREACEWVVRTDDGDRIEIEVTSDRGVFDHCTLDVDD